MKYLVVLVITTVFSQAVMASAVNCQTKPTKSSNLSVRQTLNGMPIGQLRPNTPIQVFNYDTDNTGQLLAYVGWQGQPLYSVKKPELQNSGWIVRAAISCAY